MRTTERTPSAFARFVRVTSLGSRPRAEELAVRTGLSGLHIVCRHSVRDHGGVTVAAAFVVFFTRCLSLSWQDADPVRAFSALRDTSLPHHYWPGPHAAMGVHGLWPLLHPVARPVALETMGGKKLAIDSSIWLYQFQIAMRDKDGRALDNAHILGFLRRICKLLFYGIKPVCSSLNGLRTMTWC